MQFNLLNDQERVAQFVWRGIVLPCMALTLGFISTFFLGGGRVPAVFLECACIISMWHFFSGVFGQF